MVGKKGKKEQDNAIPEISNENLKLFTLFVFITLIIVIGLMLFNKSQQKPEEFTELFLENQTVQKIFTGQEAEFAFIIKNNQSKKTDYEYFVLFDGKNLSKKISLESGEEEKFSEKVFFSSEGQKKIALELKNLDTNKVLELWKWIEVEK